MKRMSRRSLEALVLAAVALSANSARAQNAGAGTATGIGMGMGMGYGMGLGMGIGMGNFRYAPSPTDYLNQRSSQIAARRSPAGPQGTLANGPNAYYNRLRNDGSVTNYDPPVRRSSAQRRPPADLAHRQGAADSAKPASKPKQIHRLADFFDASQKVAWPADSPGEAELKEKRDLFERAGLAVLKETRESGVASADSVSAARQKLLDYGRPALQEVRASATPQVADSFHQFLRSLYDSLGQSAMPSDVKPDVVPKP